MSCFVAAALGDAVVDDGQMVGLVTVRQVNAVPADDRARTTLREVACPLAEVARLLRMSRSPTCRPKAGRTGRLRPADLPRIRRPSQLISHGT